jgi:hypothetical protein
MATETAEPGQPVKLARKSYRRLLELQQVIAARGWQVVGVQSTEQATLAAVMGMAIEQVCDLVPELASAKRES